ncbi:N-methylhydantoinase A [Haladaptatus litoreus]|uniref:N-methylhydantoinase A n=1 Tax=Haladaptatus litoreus TaxID=553468 RepID=A0A1N7F146_9EURY|nr:hydantoinase/oxoprolinase family protein [Haladaptatus litoreus]SIR93962.1 N-methylhydantoinase A [Haladaptatus litoreus]
MTTIQIGVDVGGTNTDVIMVADDMEVTHKLPTTIDPSESSATGVAEIAEQHDIDPADIDTVLHGTTVGTNALIENEGAKTGMLTTEGFRDAIHIGRHRKLHTFSIQFEQPQQANPIVPRRRRKTISERIYPPGEVVRPLDEDEVIEATGELVDDGVESIAVCYLHSYLDTTHEDRTKELVQEHFPNVTVSTSNEVVNQFREYERFTTTAINARLAPVMSNYLDRFERQLAEFGFKNADTLIMQSSGGMASVREVTRKPITTLLSGPAGGVLSGQFSGQKVNEDKLITIDMGGTSADISVVPGRLLERDARDSKVANYPTVTQMLDVETIGSGGGSIAWFDRAHGFNVGPKSAGANPGPAAMNRGGERPTVTDAQVVLGRIDPDAFLGGDIELKPELAREAIEKHLLDVVDQEQFSTVERAALATLEVANSNMYQSIREQTIRRGYDPREYTLTGFGGAGPMHTVDLAEELDVSTVLIPPSPGIASARGLLTGDVKYDNQVTVSQRLSTVDADEVDRRFETLVERGTEQLRGDGIDVDERATLEMLVDMLYEGQGYELTVEFDGTDGDWRERLRERFERKHEVEYGHYFEDDPIELLNLRVSASAESIPYEPQTVDENADAEGAKTGESTVVFGTSSNPEPQTVARYDRDRLGSGSVIDGPAIVDEFDSTVVINPGWNAEVLESGSIRLTNDGGA